MSGGNINENTKMPLRWVIVLLCSCVAMTTGIISAVSVIRNDISSLKNTMDVLPSTLLTRSEFIDWRQALQDYNRSLEVPRVYTYYPPTSQQLHSPKATP